MPIILAVDVGNSRAKFGLFEVGQASCPQLLDVTAVRLDDCLHVSAEVANWLQDSDLPDSAIVAGSNPPVRDQLLQAWPFPEIPPAVIGHHADIPIEMDVEEQASVGIDRLLTAYAVRQLLPKTQPTIVIDSGTATTVNLVTSNGTFRGGAILPGLRLSAYALHDYTARLPLVDTDQLSPEPGHVDAPLPGRNTPDAMKAGLFWGQLGAIRELSTRLAAVAQSSFGDLQPPIHVLTGGGGRQLASYLNNAIYIDSLTLHALALLAARSASRYDSSAAFTRLAGRK